MREAQGLLFCDLSDYTVYLNQLEDQQLLWFAEVYEGLLKKLMELRYRHPGKYLANRMGDGFIWLDFAENDPLGLLDFTMEAVDPVIQAFIKTVKVLADGPGLRGARYTLLPGLVVYAEARIDKETAGRTSTSRIDFLSPRINLAARITALPESADFFALGDQAFRDCLAAGRPEAAAGLIDLGHRALKGLAQAPRVWGWRPREDRRGYYRPE
jgi:class 3 adenylate cyclase